MSMRNPWGVSSLRASAHLFSHMKRLLIVITSAFVAVAQQIGLAKPPVVQAPKVWKLPAHKWSDDL